jgi:hypothetical protein
MDLNEVKIRLEKIKKKSHDYEVAHQMEDDLYRNFIQHVGALKIADLSEMAKEVLKSKKIKFSRYTA